MRFTLVNIGSGAAFSFRLDAQNRPRLAFYTGYLGSDNPNNNVLAYAWCNATCTLESNWDNYAPGLLLSMAPRWTWRWISRDTPIWLLRRQRVYLLGIRLRGLHGELRGPHRRLAEPVRRDLG